MLQGKVFSGVIEEVEYTIEFHTDYLRLCQGAAKLEWLETIEVDGIQYYRKQELNFIYQADATDRTAKLYPIWNQIDKDIYSGYYEPEEYIRVFVYSGGIIPYDKDLPVLEYVGSVK
jgi:hypothetical protein